MLYLGGETHAGQWLCGVQQTAYSPQNEYDVSQGQGPTLVHIQAKSQVRIDKGRKKEKNDLWMRTKC